MRRLYFITTLLVSCVAIHAAVLTPEQAFKRVKTSESRHIKGKPYRLVSTYKAADKLPALYIFAGEDTEGFTLVSADDLVAPVLGYSDSGTWDQTNLPPQMEWWLEEYASQIEYARTYPDRIQSYQKRNASTRAADMDPISPMVTSKWDQTYPYNLQCPMEGNSRTLTGCVATAMAQVMYYWKYPEIGTGTVAYLPSNDLIDDLSLDFSAQPFDWANMVDSYRRDYTGVQAVAVAYLMKACGYSVKMEYGSDASGALSESIPGALRNYFNYDKEIQTLVRPTNGSPTSWNNKIYDQLKYNGPVIYSGTSNLALRTGHCFICDGYDQGGYFHINWGWSGISDGYYLLSVLNPSTLGSGGGEAGGYIYNQDVITGITPPVGRITVSNLTISNAASDSGNMEGRGYIYRINDPDNITISMTVSVNGGPVASPIEIAIYETDPETWKNVGLVHEEMFPDKLNAPAGSMLDFSHSFNFREFDSSKLYTINVFYTLKGQKNYIDNLRMAASSGVEEILAGECRYDIYDLGGRLLRSVTSENSKEALSGLTNGVYIVHAVDSAGRASTIKIII